MIATDWHGQPRTVSPLVSRSQHNGRKILDTPRLLCSRTDIDPVEVKVKAENERMTKVKGPIRFDVPQFEP